MWRTGKRILVVPKSEIITAVIIVMIEYAWTLGPPCMYRGIFSKSKRSNSDSLSVIAAGNTLNAVSQTGGWLRTCHFSTKIIIKAIIICPVILESSCEIIFCFIITVLAALFYI